MSGFVEHSKAFIAIISEAHNNYEFSLAVNKWQKNNDYRIIPVRVANVAVPDKIAMFGEGICLFGIIADSKEKELLKVRAALPPPLAPNPISRTAFSSEGQAGTPTSEGNGEAGVPIAGINRFSVALSFAGEYREKYVEPIANGLTLKFCSKEKILYDKFHEEEFARKDLHSYLSKLYREDSDLIVVFIGKYYNEKSWCGFEWRAIKDFLSDSPENDDRVMFLRVDDGNVNEFYGSLDGFIDIRERDVEYIVASIRKRYERVCRSLVKNDDSEKSYCSSMANKILTKIKKCYPDEVELHRFSKETIYGAEDEFAFAGKSLSDSDLDNMIAKILMRYSKKLDNPKQKHRYLCEAIGLLKKSGSVNSELLSECIGLKAEAYGEMDGRGNKLMARLLSQSAVFAPLKNIL